MLHLPNVLPDELLFSRIIRYLMISNLPASKLLSAVYGYPRACIHPYITAGLSNLAKISGENVEVLVYQQTLAPLYLRCLPAHSLEIYTALLSTDNYKATRSCQLSCVREREALSLKFCPHCVESDINNFGVSYWHRSHQISGIEACAKHQRWLVHEELPSRIRTNIGLPSIVNYSGISTELSFELANYAKKILSLRQDDSIPVGNEYYKKRLHELGYVTKDGRCRRRLLSTNFYNYFKRLRYPSNNLLPQAEDDYKYLSGLLRQNVSQQPFKHILFSFWLNKAEPINSNVELTTTDVTETCDQKKEQCIELLKKGRTFESISKKIGKSRCFVKAVALNAQIYNQIKPFKLTPKVCRSIIQYAKKGFHRREIAQRLSISSGSVEMLISTTQGLVKWRKQCKHESKRRRYKVQILRYRENHQHAIRKDIKRDCNAAFFWLYQHERGWLEEHLPDALSPYSSPRRKKHIKGSTI